MKDKLIAAICGLLSFFIFFKVVKILSSAVWNGTNDFINAVFGVFLILVILVASVAVSQKVYSKLNSHFWKWWNLHINGSIKNTIKKRNNVKKEMFQYWDISFLFWEVFETISCYYNINIFKGDIKDEYIRDEKS